MLLLLLPAQQILVQAFQTPVAVSSPRSFSKNNAVFSAAAPRLLRSTATLASDDVTVTDAPRSENTVKVAQIQRDLMDLAEHTQRGFRATQQEKRRARDLILELARYNDAKEPARAYYRDENSSEQDNNNLQEPSLTGKWELIYTDAPDITSLDQNRLADLGRIGQECQPPFIKNVIEWKRPDWAASLPFAGSTSETPRILLKVVTQATADPSQPTAVNLKVAGLSLEAAPNQDDDKNNNNMIARKGLLAGLLQQRPLESPINTNAAALLLPFGNFEVLYLDDTLRVTRTGQNHMGVNRRVCSDDEAWF